jgi:4,4'-diaponeurosporenoate glycosyltransferase
MTLVLAWLGFALLVWRLAPRKLTEFSTRRNSPPHVDAENLPRVSIIIPARNEASNLPTLLDSLKKLNYPRFEVIVVDDHSDDATWEIAKSYGVKVIAADEKPEHWAGKTWACWQGAQAATGEFYLFTDADTLHLEDSLHQAINFVTEKKLDLCSTPPYHRTFKFWESLLGPFHLLLLFATAPYHRPKPRRLFAIGQYLLFKMDYYWALGGHKAVRETLAEDLAFATMTLESGGNYGVYTQQPLYHVRMYATFREFLAGWRRIIRWGMERGHVWSTVEVVLVMFAVLGAGKLLTDVPHLWVALMTLSFMGLMQRRWGDFSIWGVIFFPFAVVVFCWVTLLATGDRIFRRPSYWRGRAYRAGIN